MMCLIVRYSVVEISQSNEFSIKIRMIKYEKWRRIEFNTISMLTFISNKYKMYITWRWNDC